MDSRAPTRRFKSYTATRLLTVAALAFALLCGAAPSGGLSAAPGICQMDCCAGRPPHASGSCTHGSCHVDLQALEPAPPEEHGGHGAAPAREAEHHGDAHDAHAHDAPPPPTEHASQKNHHPHAPSGADSTPEQSPRHESHSTTAGVVRNALTKPCPPECGAGTSGYSGQRRPRDDAAAAHADKPRPPSGLLLRHTPYEVAGAPEDSCRRPRPRGPPPSFS